MPHKIKIHNAPLFPDKTREKGITGTAKWEEPLLGPSDRVVGSPPGDPSNLKALYQNQSATPELTPPFPAPIQDSDSPNDDDFTSSTIKNLDTGGLV